MEFKGTKGKWEIFSKSEARISMLNGSIDVWNFDNDKNIDLSEAKANAQLISKAPEMLEMLELACIEIESVGKKHWDIYGMMKQLIKEATTI